MKVKADLIEKGCERGFSLAKQLTSGTIQQFRVEADFVLLTGPPFNLQVTRL
jgi:hypothetical protein